MMLASIRDTKGRNGRYFRFGVDDNFPNLLADYVNDSGTARLCVEKLNQFLYGGGLSDTMFEEERANPYETWGELIPKIIEQVNYFEGFVIQVKFDRAGRPARYYVPTFQHFRKRYDGKFIYNPEYGDPQGYSALAMTTDVIIPPFRTSYNELEEGHIAESRRRLVAEQVKEYGQQYGELLYVQRSGVGLKYDVYPVPTYASGLNDLAADSGLSVHEESAVSNSFKAGVLIITRPLNRDEEDDDGKTEYDHFVDEMKEFTSPDGSPIAHIESDIAQNEVPQIVPLNIQHQMDATQQATERLAKKVCRLFSVPPVVIGIETAGKLGNSQELHHHFKLFNLALDYKRKLIARGLAKLFPEVGRDNFMLEPLDMFVGVPESLAAQLTPSQIQEIWDIPEALDGENPVGPLNPLNPALPQPSFNFDEEEEAMHNWMRSLTGREEQGLQRILRKFVRGEYSERQAIIMMEMRFKIPEKVAVALLEEERVKNEE